MKFQNIVVALKALLVDASDLYVLVLVIVWVLKCESCSKHAVTSRAYRTTVIVMFVLK